MFNGSFGLSKGVIWGSNGDIASNTTRKWRTFLPVLCQFSWEHEEDDHPFISVSWGGWLWAASTFGAPQFPQTHGRLRSADARQVLLRSWSKETSQLQGMLGIYPVSYLSIDLSEYDWSWFIWVMLVSATELVSIAFFSFDPPVIKHGNGKSPIRSCSQL